MHPLMMLAHIAWQRETSDPNYMNDKYEKEVSLFNFSAKKLAAELISTDWSEIFQRMQDYKKLRFPDDNRMVTSGVLKLYGLTEEEIKIVEGEC